MCFILSFFDYMHQAFNVEKKYTKKQKKIKRKIKHKMHKRKRL